MSQHQNITLKRKYFQSENQPNEDIELIELESSDEDEYQRNTTTNRNIGHNYQVIELSSDTD